MKRGEILAYTAGIVDGEGSPHIFKTKAKEMTTGFKVEMRVSVSNTNKQLCQWLKLQFGGCVFPLKPKKATWKLGYQWCLRANQASKFLEIILPYLQIKRPQAELAIKFQSLYDAKNRAIVGKDLQALREADYILMKSLNKKGVEENLHEEVSLDLSMP